MMTGVSRRNVTKEQVQTEFRAWIREAAKRRGMSQSDIAWNFPFQVSVDSVQNWYAGKTPDYRHFIGLCVALGELPPVLQELCVPASS